MEEFHCVMSVLYWSSAGTEVAEHVQLFVEENKKNNMFKMMPKLMERQAPGGERVEKRMDGRCESLGMSFIVWSKSSTTPASLRRDGCGNW